jgi:hypothetical protein
MHLCLTTFTLFSIFFVKDFNCKVVEDQAADSKQQDGPPVKIELERAGQAADAVAGQKRSRGIIVNETRLENGKLLLEVQDDDDEEEIQATARDRALAIAERIAAVEDDDVVFVTVKPVQKTRAEMENAARPRFKHEG